MTPTYPACSTCRWWGRPDEIQAKKPLRTCRRAVVTELASGDPRAFGICGGSSHAHQGVFTTGSGFSCIHHSLP